MCKKLISKRKTVPSFLQKYHQNCQTKYCRFVYKTYIWFFLQSKTPNNLIWSAPSILFHRNILKEIKWGRERTTYFQCPIINFVAYWIAWTYVECWIVGLSLAFANNLIPSGIWGKTNQNNVTRWKKIGSFPKLHSSLDSTTNLWVGLRVQHVFWSTYVEKEICFTSAVL